MYNDTDDHPSIEAYIYQTDPFRSATAPDPLPCPLKRNLAPNDAGLPIALRRQETGDILASHGLPPNFSLNVAQKSKPSYPGGDIERLVVTVGFRGVASENFDAAREEINAFLNTTHDYNVDVEVMDFDQFVVPDFFRSPCGRGV
ncbi:hypothetical protein AWENTII_009442 [Aspergillus wentii]